MAPSTTARRLLKEVAELSTSTPDPNPTFYAAPVSDSDLHEWHFTLLGPPSPSPYAGGLYHGRISLPVQYPLKPPNFRFLTPSGRFEVNREICLSISGFHEETWMPAWGVRTALTALRSFMAEKGTAGQVGGLEANDEVRRQLAKDSRKWRCAECARTNEDVIRDWWSHCKEAGVKVDEEGCDMGLEALPEGMNVTAFVKSKDEGKRPDVPPASGEHAPLDEAEQAKNATNVDAKPPRRVLDSSISTANSTAAGAANSITSSQPNLTPASPSSPRASIVPSQPTPQPGAQRLPHQEPVEARFVNLDHVIMAVFLALCFMVLKKIFYPPSVGGSGHGANDDWEIGLSKEY